MRLVSEVATYFHPQRQTQVMNEGWASFWHYTLVHDLSELGLIDHGMMMEFYDSHGGVVRQTGITDTVTVRGADGQPEERNIYSGINPYALGISMFQDIKRICLEPTEEDKKWFPYIAGNEDWLSVMKDARNNFKDESFIQQFMSPKLMRDFKFFAMENDSDKDYVEILAIHDTDGYSAVRENLSAQYRYDENMPVIGVAEYYDKTDRRLVLNHKMHNGKPLDKKNMTEITKHMYRLWEHPIVVQSIDKDGDVVDETCCPAKPDVRRQRKLRLN